MSLRTFKTNLVVLPAHDGHNEDDGEHHDKLDDDWAVVVAQLVEQSLPTPEGRGSNPVIGKNLMLDVYVQQFLKTKIKKKEPGIGPFL